MTDTILLRRGDARELNVAGLRDEFGSPAVFGALDVLTWTAKTHPDAAVPLIVKSSTDGGIDVDVGTDQATIHIVPADFDLIPSLAIDLPYVWDLEYLLGGDPLELRTIDDGDGLILPDVTGNIPTPVTVGTGTGPCMPWVTPAEVAADPTCRRASGEAFTLNQLIEAIDLASFVLYNLTARLFPGECARTVRPIPHMFQWFPLAPISSWPVTLGGRYPGWSPHRRANTKECSLGVNWIRGIDAVYCDGELLTDDLYYLKDRRWLVRNDPSGIGWPYDQNLDLDPHVDLNTMEVAFRHGQDPPNPGKTACKAYAIEFAKARSGDRCMLPERVTSVTMQGVSFALLDPMNFMDKGRTGVYLVDQFVNAVNPTGMRRRASVINPDFAAPAHIIDYTPHS